MFKQYLQHIDGITGYPLFLLVVFILFFTAMTIAVAKMKKVQAGYLSRLPLTDNSEAKQDL